MTNNPLKNINRIDIALTNQHGWQVRTHIGKQDRSKWFADRRYYNSPAHSLNKAIQYRDVMIDVLNK